MSKKTISTFKVLFNLTLTIAAIFLIISLWLSIDVINETGDWKTLNVDFTGQSDVISAYASLLSGVLFFLSILFLIMDMINQRRKYQIEVDKEKESKKRELIDRLEITSTFLEDIIKNIIFQGDNLKKYYDEEIDNPTQTHQCYFITNSSIETILNLDTITTYNAFQKFKPGSNWKKDFLNLIKILNYYKEIIPHLHENYKGHTQDKVALKTKIQQSLDSFMATLSNLQNNLVAEYKRSNDTKFKLIIDFFEDYLIKYNAQTKADAEYGDSDLTNYAVNHYKPFTVNGVELIEKDNTYTKFISPLLQQMGNIIIEIKRLESMALFYANDLRKNKEDYLDKTSEHLAKLESIKLEIDNISI